MGSPAPQYKPPPDDPQYLALKQQADQDQIAAGQQRAEVDSASLMARYGTRLTLAGAVGSGGVAAAGASPTLAAPSGLDSLLSTVLSKYAGGGLPSVAATTGRVIGGGAAA